MTATDPPEWQQRCTAHADRLLADGAIRTAAWHAAWCAIPRHHFVPLFHRRTDDWLPVSAPTPAWLTGVYSAGTLPTALSAFDPGVPRHAVAASPDPALTARSLHALALQPGMRVLEIGTGTGHTTGLLAHRQGSARVTTIDIDPDLRNAARDRLADLGLHPTMLLGDATVPRHVAGPYDRIVVGFEVDHVPAHWIDWVRPGGVVLVRLAGPEIRRHLLLTRAANGDDALVGAVLPWTGELPGRRRPAHPNGLRRSRGGRAVVAKDLLPDLLHATATDLGDRTPGNCTRFGLTVTRDAHRLWLDDPGGPFSWPLPVPGGAL